MATALFSLGIVYVTPGALCACASYPMPPEVLLARHYSGDWSELSETDRNANVEAVRSGKRVFSAYQIGLERLYVITEPGRRITTVLLADEY